MPYLHAISRRLILRETTLFILFLWAAPAFAQNGHVLDGMGAINQGMGGVSAGLAVEPLGALHWNPAASGGLPEDQSSRIALSVVGFSPTTTISSSIAANSFGAGAPSADLSGSTTSGSGDSYIPSLAIVHAPRDSEWLYGLGVYGISGFGVDYPMDASNPILTPQPPAGMGFGAIFSQYQVLQISPTLGRRLNKRWTLAIAPTINIGSLAVSPFSGTYPDDANGDSFASYPINRDSEVSLGFGVKLGAFWQGESGWSAGAALKSPIWFSDYDFEATDENGAPREYSFDLDYPAIGSLGLGYSAPQGWRIGADVRWIDYAHTNGFKESGFAADGSVQGFHWRSIPVIALGGEFPVNEDLSLLGGFSWNANPIRSEDMFFNSPSPALIQSHLSLGLKWRLDAGLEMGLAYMHGFSNSLSGPFQGASGPISGADVTSELEVDSVTFSCSWEF
jgi:long-chain fatty acid transport protein